MADLPQISEQDKYWLDRSKAGYMNIVRYPSVVEDTIKMVVLSPLLNSAGFFLQPFYINSEHPIQLTDTDEEIPMEGKINVLVLKNVAGLKMYDFDQDKKEESFQSLPFIDESEEKL